MENSISPPCQFCKGTRAMLENYISDVKKWLAKPYDENGDILDWALFFGLMVAITILWTRVISRILD